MIRIRDGLHWLQPEYGGRRIYLCWYVACGSFGQKAVVKTLLGRQS